MPGARAYLPPALFFFAFFFGVFGFGGAMFMIAAKPAPCTTPSSRRVKGHTARNCWAVPWKLFRSTPPPAPGVLCGSGPTSPSVYCHKAYVGQICVGIPMGEFA